VAIFLESILPPGVPVHGGLRYSLARALLDVDAPPYDSLEDFSLALARYERADRAQVVRGLVARASRVRATGGLVVVRRHHAAASLAKFRRQLRDEANARVPVGDLAIDASSVSAARARHRPSGLQPLAVGLALGLALISVGEILHSQRTSYAAVAPQPVSVNETIHTPAVANTLSDQGTLRAASAHAAAPPGAEALGKPEARRGARETSTGPRSAHGRGKTSFFRRLFHTRLAIRAVPL
jgi:hypothetical protein